MPRTGEAPRAQAPLGAAAGPQMPGITAGRLDAAALALNFGD